MVPEPATGVALNRLLMTLQNKRMPVAGFTLAREAGGMRATLLLDCPPESAQRYTALISALEDVSEAGPTETIEVALIETSSDWRWASERAGISAHENAGTVVFFFKCYGDHRDLHSFPTRRSSDLWSAPGAVRRVARPRPARRAWPSGPTRTLAGRRSRWGRPAAWAASRASRSSRPSWAARRTGSGPWRAVSSSR